MVDTFQLKSAFQPTGDQPGAIAELTAGVRQGFPTQTLLGVTGSGKTFTVAGVIQEVQRPTLVIAHNKTLAAQLCGEFREFFPDNAVEYFVSYYDYYQPEAYVPQTDTYIEKDSSLNEEIDKLRHSATASIFERRDVIIVASVSCIYGLGSPVAYRDMMLSLRQGMKVDRDSVLAKLVDIQYTRNDYDFARGRFRVRGDVLEIFPASFSEKALRVEFFGDEIERILEIDTLTGEMLSRRLHAVVFPASHYVTPRSEMERAIAGIEDGVGRAPAGTAERGEAAGGPAPGAAHPLRPGDDAGGGLLQGDRELLPPPDRAQARGAALLPAGLLSPGLAGGDRRVPPDHPPTERHVRRGLLPEAHPGGLRLPAALGAGQPPAALRRVRGPGCPRSSSSRPRPGTTSCPGAARWWSRSSAPPG